MSKEMAKNYKVLFTQPKQVELVCEDIPPVGDDEILLRTLVSQISIGTELTCLMGEVDKDSSWNDDIKYPTNPGYSNVSQIVKIGKNVDPALVGKRLKAAISHATYHVVNVKLLEGEDSLYVPIPENVSNDEAVFSSLGVVAMASIRAREVKPGSTVLVFGAGLVGQLVARLAKVAGASKVIVTDVSDHRLSFVPKTPGFVAVNSLDTDIVEYVAGLTDGEMADIVYETTANANLISTEMKCAAERGAVVITSSPKTKSLIDLNYCNVKGLTIIGAANWMIHPTKVTADNRWTQNRENKFFLQLLSDRQISTAEMVTHRIHCQNAPDMYRQLMEDRTKMLAVHIDWADNQE